MLQVILTIVCPILVPLVKFADNETSRAVHNNDIEDPADSKPTALNRVMPDNGSGVQFTQSKAGQKRNRRGKNPFFQVMCCGDTLRSGLNIDFCRAMFYFYTAPVTKFYCSMVSELYQSVHVSFKLLLFLRKCLSYKWNIGLKKSRNLYRKYEGMFECIRGTHIRHAK